MRPKYFARSAKVVSSVSTMRAPLKMPVPPAPASARPKMRTFMLGATPQMREPSSNTTTAKSVMCFAGKIASHWANARLKARSVMLEIEC